MENMFRLEVTVAEYSVLRPSIGGRTGKGAEWSRGEASKSLAIATYKYFSNDAYFQK